MNSITSIDHKSADSAMHETIVNAVGELYDGSLQNSHNPVKSVQKARVPDSRVLFLFLQLYGERFSRERQNLFLISPLHSACNKCKILIPIIIFLIFFAP